MSDKPIPKPYSISLQMILNVLSEWDGELPDKAIFEFLRCNARATRTALKMLGYWDNALDI